ncbi:MAG: M67 family metallopeptidase [Anaerolineae bacterium]
MTLASPLPDGVREAIYAHAREDYPNECCGAVWLVGDEGSLTWEVVRCTNVQDEMHARDPEHFPRTARTAYTIAAKELLAINRRAEEPGQRLAILYHSHPDHDAYFSDEDVYFAAPLGEPGYPGTSYLVVSVRGGEVQGHRCFGWSDDKGQFIDQAC